MRKKLATKICAIVMTAAMVAGMAACGNKTDENPGGNSVTPDGSSETPGGSSETPDGSSETPSDDEGGSEEEAELFPAYDFGGITLTILKHNNLGGLDPDSKASIEDIENSDKSEEEKKAEIEKREAERQDLQDKKDAIEKKYNVHLEFVDLPTSDWESIASEIVQAYISGNPVADVMDVYYGFMATYVSNGILYDFTEDLPKSGLFKESGFLQWAGKTWGISRAIGGEGIYYNKDMIKALGMEYTPAEMFDMGKWSYDDCYDYLKEMKSYMSDDQYPLFVSPGYWLLYATQPNGVKILDDSGNLNYLADPFLETMEFFQKLCDEKLNASAAYTKDDGTTGYNNWGYPGETFDKGQTVAMSHRGAWQADGIVRNEDVDFEVGFVPYPWGSNVTIDKSAVGQPGAYKTLGDNYWHSHHDGQLLAVTKGTEAKADPVQVMSMILEWMGWDSDMAAYPEQESDGHVNWLEEGIDTEVYLWCMERQKLINWNSLDVDMMAGSGLNGVCYDGGSLRAHFESAYTADMNALIDAGYATEDMKTFVGSEE